MRYFMVLVTGTLIAFGVASLPARAMDDTQLVESWYQRYLGRGSDPGGLNNWVWQLRSGMPPDAVEACILGSDEYYVRHGQTPESFVAGLYQDVLSRVIRVSPAKVSLSTAENRVNAGKDTEALP